MEKSLKVGTWNLHGALSNPVDAKPVLRELAHAQADVIALPDAWHEDSSRSRPSYERKSRVSDELFQAMGYKVFRSTFEEDRPDDNYARYGFATLVHNREALSSATTIELGTRPAHHLRINMGAHALNVISLYLNDQSEENRYKQVGTLLDYLDPYFFEPTILVGDFNAMHADSKIAQLLQSDRAHDLLGGIKAKNNTIPRLIEMADGATMNNLEAAGFVDAEPKYRPTMPSLLPLFQLDHIMMRDGALASLTATRPKRTLELSASDHAFITSHITLHKK